MPLAFWICAAISCVSAGVGFGFSLGSALRSTGRTRVAFLYTLARSSALLAAAGVAFFTGSIAFVAAVAIAMVIVQAVDAGIGLATRNRMATIGPSLAALINLAALVWLLA